MNGVRAHDLRLLPLALAAWGAAALAGTLPVVTVLHWGGALVAGAWSVVACGVAALVLLRRSRGAPVLVVVAVALAGGALALTAVIVTAPGRHPEALREAAESRAEVEILVRVDTSTRALATGGVWFDATALRVGRNAVSAPVRVFLGEPGGAFLWPRSSSSRRVPTAEQRARWSERAPS